MKNRRFIDRRRFLKGALQASSLLLLAGCDNLSQSLWFTGFLHKTEKVTRRAQRAVVSRQALAREYTEADLSETFPANGNTDPGTLAYHESAARDFADWRLEVDGLVQRPVGLSLAEIRALPLHTQITRHDCVEGWSAIAKWTGVPLREVIERAQPLPGARYVVFRCADVDSRGVPYYESIVLEDVYHPQTILAYEMNDQPLDIAHGAPLRLRLERQLGYKHAKYVMRLELVETLNGIGGGRGGYWEDQGYEWYAGI